ncbi:glycosyl hydrolase family 61 [Colletotrichum karsti]|uniref:lytic cellulose monooxygenase (C4-dehydrogenating) n=1 Tax=Colletotrichum karsti TaxID=1095194 RepID=A0A9P6I5B5_9PEZI|nr:glycosyl hydrolase family 61 [Colletotrichum karsti]KAF9877568.1 glycosyl hydrolase family 61 [Colletotrichum karsti]
MYSKAFLAALVGATAVSAHGYVEKITAGGSTVDGLNPSSYPYASEKPVTPGWAATNTDLGFVAPDATGDADIICHRGATPGTSSIKVAAGEKVTVKWNTWPDSHKGPIMDYLAKCSGDCTKATKADLKFFKVAEQGLSGGKWAAEKLLENNLNWDITIPGDVAAGNYVLRHEILALHSAGQENGAQFYPQCINLEVTGGGSANPTGVAGTSLYTAKDAGVIFDIYSGKTDYSIPGPAVYSAKKRRSHARDMTIVN